MQMFANSLNGKEAGWLFKGAKRFAESKIGEDIKDDPLGPIGQVPWT